MEVFYLLQDLCSCLRGSLRLKEMCIQTGKYNATPHHYPLGSISSRCSGKEPALPALETGDLVREKVPSVFGTALGLWRRDTLKTLGTHFPNTEFSFSK